MKTVLPTITIALLMNASAFAAPQTPPAGDPSGGSTGIVTPSMRPPASSPAPSGVQPSRGSTGIVTPSMTPPLTLPNKPQTPTQSAGDGSVKRARLPAVLVYTATLKSVAGTLSPRLGGWSCDGNLCTLRTTGEASLVNAVQACRSFHQMAEERGAKVAIAVFEVNQKVRLGKAELRRCMS